MEEHENENENENENEETQSLACILHLFSDSDLATRIETRQRGAMEMKEMSTLTKPKKEQKRHHWGRYLPCEKLSVVIQKCEDCGCTRETLNYEDGSFCSAKYLVEGIRCYANRAPSCPPTEAERSRLAAIIGPPPGYGPEAPSRPEPMRRVAAVGMARPSDYCSPGGKQRYHHKCAMARVEKTTVLDGGCVLLTLRITPRLANRSDDSSPA